MPHNFEVVERRRLAGRLLRPIQAFVGTEVAGGVAVLAATIVAFAWANSPWDGRYFDLWATSVDISAGRLSLHQSLGHLVSDGLMTLFFFVIGLETKRELLHGELAGVRKAALPVAAALGGMIVPAAVFLAFNARGDGAAGWGIPIATDIAFALGVVALLGNRVPFALKVFLLALAVVDDIGAILVIALFYTDSLSLEASLWAIGIVVTIICARRAGIQSIAVYALLGAALWFAVLKTGVHPTIAGVVLAILTPASTARASRPLPEEAAELLSGLEADPESAQTRLNELEALVRRNEAPLERLERRLHPWVVFFVVPVFALANAGIPITADSLETATTSAVSAGVFFGLLLGKPAGILFATWLAVRLRVATLPPGLGWNHIGGAAVLGGIGFTVSLFVTDLAFEGSPLAESARLAILAASVAAAVAGYVLLRLTPPVSPEGG